MNSINNSEKKIIREKDIIFKMITIYCRGNRHESGEGLCLDCHELFMYAENKIEKCPFIDTKTFCSSCKVHCYDDIHREKIRNVMRFAGPRMMLRAPHLVILHIFDRVKTKKD